MGRSTPCFFNSLPLGKDASNMRNDRTLTFPLPEDIKQIRYFGPYVKGTSSAFAPIEVVEAK